MGLDSQSSLYDSWPLVCRPCALYRLCKDPPAGPLFSYSISSSRQMTQRPRQEDSPTLTSQEGHSFSHVALMWTDKQTERTSETALKSHFRVEIKVRKIVFSSSEVSASHRILRKM